jgi:hypothetical protein
MPSIEPSITPLRNCPLCDAPLDPANPNECPKCDWHVDYERNKPDAPKANVRDVAAVVMSVIPGLGHIYKGHKLSGALYMLGALFAFFGAAVASTATAGFGLLLLPIYWAGVMLHVYWVDDIAVPPARRS